MALAARLLELAAVVESLDDATYVSVRRDGVSGSIGAHVRHTLDHVAALLEPAAAGVIDYDTRRRGTDVETRKGRAAAELRRLARSLQSPELAFDRRVELSAVVDPTGRRVRAETTLERELVFALSHTIHHQAIVALLLADAGRMTPARFGLAPATPSRVPCAQSA
jgi:uncharacterized damage-inducible protein DinB